MILPNFPSFKNFFLVFSFFLPFYTSKTSCRFTLLLPVSQWVYDKSRVPLTTQAAESHRPYSCYSRYSCSLNLSSNRANRPYSCNSRYSCSFKSPAAESHGLIRIDSPYYFSLTSGSTTNLVFVSLTRTFRLSLFALHSQTSLPVPTSPPSCISTARCPPQPRYSHQDHLSQPTYP